MVGSAAEWVAKRKKTQISLVNLYDPPLESANKNKLLFIVKLSVSEFLINSNSAILGFMMMFSSVTLSSGSNKVLQEHPVFPLQEEQEGKIEKLLLFC